MDKIDTQETKQNFLSSKFSPPIKVEFRVDDSEETKQLVSAISAEIGVSEITAQILVSRGIASIADAKEFLQPTLKDHLPEPSEIKNVEKAADLLLAAVSQQKQITVYTDFDVDGISSGSQLFLFLKELGANVGTYTPSRFDEGYGLSPEAVEKLAKGGTEVLVTVDCGITNNREIDLAKRRGMTTIIVDHHLPDLLPNADVIVDPAQEGCPFRDHKLAAAGLVWMLLIVLRQRAKGEAPNPKDYLDLAALGTICDMVPLVGLNRLIAYRGIEALRRSERLGVVALKEVSGINPLRKFTTGNVSFGMGPRINAAGRLGEAGQVLEMFTTKDQKQAKKIAERIDGLNKQRQKIEEEVKKQCIDFVLESPDIASSKAFALYGKNFHIGVIGIVAQRLVEHFNRPAAVMGPGQAVIAGELTQVVKGSVRSIPAFHVANSLKKVSHLLISHGGHAEAGGFSLTFDKLEEFQTAFVELANTTLSDEMLGRFRKADVEVGISDIGFELIDELAMLAPFGVGNPSPILVARNLNIVSVSDLTGSHLRLRLSDGTEAVNAVAWGYKGHPLIRKGNKVSVAFSPEVNNYRGVSNIQLNLKDLWQEE